MGGVLTKLKKIKPNTDDDDKEKKKYQKMEHAYGDGTRKKSEVPIFYGGNVKSIIRTIREFEEAVRDLECDTTQDNFANLVSVYVMGPEMTGTP